MIQTIKTGVLFDISNFWNNESTLIETGTCHGDGVDRALKAGFNRVISVEAHMELFQECVAKYLNDDRVELYPGLSTDKLDHMLRIAPKNCVILLDAHPAGPTTAGHVDLITKGAESEFQQDTIITKELAIIANYCKIHDSKPTIIIDDQNGDNPQNVEYMKTIKGIDTNYEFSYYDEVLGNGIEYKNKILVAQISI